MNRKAPKCPNLRHNFYSLNIYLGKDNDFFLMRIICQYSLGYKTDFVVVTATNVIVSQRKVNKYLMESWLTMKFFLHNF